MKKQNIQTRNAYSHIDMNSEKNSCKVNVFLHIHRQRYSFIKNFEFIGAFEIVKNPHTYDLTWYSYNVKIESNEQKKDISPVTKKNVFWVRYKFTI